MAGPVDDPLRLASVDVERDGQAVLSGVDWRVGPGERWVVIGPNGAGKTTLFELAAAYLHPTRGRVEILGQRLGRVDVRRLRARIGLVSSSLANKLVADLSADDVVLAGRRGALEPWWQSYGPHERRQAKDLLEQAGFGHLTGRRFGHLSDGERQQVLLARALIGDPELLLLDEAAAGLDLGGRERLIAYLDRLAATPGHPPTVMVTHHLEEIPMSFTHALLLRAGTVMAAGPIDDVLDSDNVSETFGLALLTRRRGGRWSCVAR